MKSTDCHPSRARGFSLIEMMVTLAIVAILAGLTLLAFSALRTQSNRRTFAADLVADMLMARSRALALQRTQVVVIDAAAGANGVFGYFHLEDTATANADGGVPQNIFVQSDLTAVLGALNPSVPSTTPSPYVLSALESNEQTISPFYQSATSWGGALPFPFAAIPQDTSAGCSFCTGGLGAIAFLPNGRATFSDGNAVGGLITVQGKGGTGTASISGIVVSTTSLVQLLVK